MKLLKNIVVLALLSAFALPAFAVLQCSGDNGTAVWHVGDRVKQELAWDDPESVECFANGAELAYIQHYFTGIPMVRGAPLVVWYGDTGIFIFSNVR